MAKRGGQKFTQRLTRDALMACHSKLLLSNDQFKMEANRHDLASRVSGGS